MNIVTVDNYPPYLSSTLPGGGVGIELVKAANMAAGLQANVVYYPTKRAQSIFLESANSAYIGLLSHFSEDEQRGLESVPILPLEVGLFYYLPYTQMEYPLRN